VKLDPESPDVLLATFGRQVEIFLASEVGIYLQQCCDAEVADALEKLKRARDMNDITALQNQIWRAESVMGWLKDAISSGHQSLEMIRESQ
jgi:hypothetical protein